MRYRNLLFACLAMLLALFVGLPAYAQEKRIVRVVSVTGSPGDTVTLPIELESQGDENAIAFSLAFNPLKLTAPSVALGSDAAGADLFVNDLGAAEGKLGIAVLQSPGITFLTGTRQIVRVSFTIPAGVTRCVVPVTLTDIPAVREITDVSAMVLTASWVDGTVTIDSPPTAEDDAYSVNEDATLSVTAPGVLGNDTDPDGDPLTAMLLSPPAHAAFFTLNADGSFTFMPALNYHGTDNFTYKASDGLLNSNQAIVNLTINPVNDRPEAKGDSYTTPEDTTLTVPAPGILANDTDADGDALTAVLNAGPAHGTLTLNTNGSFTYTPALDYVGPDSFSYKANDGTADSDPAAVDITVTPANDAPVAGDAGYSMDEDTTLNVPAPGLLAYVTDVDGDPISFVLNNYEPGTSVWIDWDGSFSYTPPENFNGTGHFGYWAWDGALLSNEGTVTITVRPVNDAPMAADDYYTVPEEATLLVTPPGVLGNDSDIDGDTLAVNAHTPPAHGTLEINANGSFAYTPVADYNGPDSFTYHADDGIADAIATVYINVTWVDDPPVAHDDTYTTAEDTALFIASPGVLANDTDIEGDLLVAIVVDDPGHGTLDLYPNGGFTYTPAPDWNGADSFTYQAYDGYQFSTTATVTVNVTPVNDAPTAVDDYYTIDEDTVLSVPAPGLLGNDSDIDGDPITLFDIGTPSHFIWVNLNPAGDFSYLPALNYHGSDSMLYYVNDGTTLSTATIHITINAVNDPPVAVDDAYTTTEDTMVSGNVLTNDTDVEGDPLTFVFVTGPSNGILGYSTDGNITYLPNLNWHGTDSFTYRANDGTDDSNLATVTITVTPVNDAPVAGDASYTTDEDTTLNVPAPGLMAYVSDADGDHLEFVVNAYEPGHAVWINADGSFGFTPLSNFHGTAHFGYWVWDGTELSNEGTVTITVRPVNDPPVASADSYGTREDVTLIVPAPGVLGNDTDIDSAVLTAVLVGGAGHGALAFNADGSFSYTPNAEWSGVDRFTYKAFDGMGYSAETTVTIDVEEMNDPPTANDDAYTTQEDIPLAIAAPGVLGNDTDPEGNPLTTALTAGPAHGTLALHADGSFNYTPNTGYHGADTFKYRANDGGADSNVATVSLTITNVNDIPKPIGDSYTTPEDTTLTVAAPGVLGNDSDPDGDAMTAVLGTGPTHGTLELHADGSFTYTPVPHYYGPDGFTYKANDGTADSEPASVIITVTHANDAPVATGDSYSMDEDTVLTVPAPGLLANDSDIDGDSLSPVLWSALPVGATFSPLPAGGFIFTPPANYVGELTFDYKAFDGTAYSNLATVTITVNATGYEADVASRPHGSGTVTIADAVQLGRFVVALDAPPATGSEFMRADCAPYAAKGDGAINLLDYVQAARYAIGMEPLMPVSGPAAASAAASVERNTANAGKPTKPSREVLIGKTTLSRGQTGTIYLVLKALGDESALSCTLQFDPARLQFVSAASMDAGGQTSLTVNAASASGGEIALCLMRNLPLTFSAGASSVVALTFSVPAGATTGTTTVGFSDAFAQCMVSAVDARMLPAKFTAGTVSIRR